MNILSLFAAWALPILSAITLREVAHGWVAFKRGDNTAYLARRITLNPLKHIDWLGTIFIPILLLMVFGLTFGWAKPIPVDMRQLKKPRLDYLLVAAAGPASNLLMAFFWALLPKLSIIWVMTFPEFEEPAVWLLLVGQAGIAINLILMLINLLPIPPFYGGQVVAGFISPRAKVMYQKLKPLVVFILFAITALHWLNPPACSPIWIVTNWMGVDLLLLLYYSVLG